MQAGQKGAQIILQICTSRHTAPSPSPWTLALLPRSPPWRSARGGSTWSWCTSSGAWTERERAKFRQLCTLQQKNCFFRGKSFLLFFSREPCFQGRPIRFFTNPYAFTQSHGRVMSQDPSSRSCYPPSLRGIRSRSSQQSVFGSVNATEWATGVGLTTGSIAWSSLTCIAAGKNRDISIKFLLPLRNISLNLK